MEIQKYCQYLYNATFIPVYLYEDEELLCSYPEQNKLIYPPNILIEKLRNGTKDIQYHMTRFSALFGLIKVKDSSLYIIIGPVSELPYTEEGFTLIQREYSVKNQDLETILNIFNYIPTMNFSMFMNQLIMINYTINGTDRKITDILLDSDIVLSETSIHQKTLESYYNHLEVNEINRNFAIQNELQHYIETGNVEELIIFSNRSKNYSLGTMANDNLRQNKNMFIIALSLSCHAAIKGGLSPSVAYGLSDTYLQHMERLTDVNDINTINLQMQIDYADRVAKCSFPVQSNDLMREIINYVRTNTNRNISVEGIANHFGYSQTYLSRKFKKDMSFGLAEFIRRCKLEDSKNLLAYTNKSISQISNYLCFSSQSHFQKAFKEQYGITPQYYRKLNNSLT